MGIEKDQKHVTKFARTMAFTAGFGLLALLLFFIYQAVLVPIVVGSFLAYLLYPVVNWLEVKLPVKRVTLILGLLSAILLAASAALLGVAPYLYAEILELIASIPTAYQTIVAEWIPYLERLAQSFGFAGDLRATASSYGTLEKLAANTQQALQTLWLTAPRVIAGLVDLLLTPAITFVTLLHGGNHIELVKRHIPAELRQPLGAFVRQIDKTLRAVVEGHLIVASILSILYCIGLSIVGLSGAIAIGLIGGMCRVVPYFDVIVGGSLSLVAIFSDFNGDWGLLFGVFLVFVVVQIIDATLITPRVIGERVGLHPVVVIVSIFALSHLMGFWGVLLAIPLVAIAKVTLSTISSLYLASPLFISQPGDLPANSNDDQKS